METNKMSPGKLNQLSLDQKLDLFKVEELEDRLEMAAIAAADEIDVEVNNGCTVNEGCW